MNPTGTQERILSEVCDGPLMLRPSSQIALILGIYNYLDARSFLSYAPILKFYKKDPQLSSDRIPCPLNMINHIISVAVYPVRFARNLANIVFKLYFHFAFNKAAIESFSFRKAIFPFDHNLLPSKRRRSHKDNAAAKDEV